MSRILVADATCDLGALLVKFGPEFKDLKTQFTLVDICLSSLRKNKNISHFINCVQI